MLPRFAIVLLAGCASASMQSGDGPRPTDASDGTHADGTTGGDAAPHPDGPSGSGTCASAMTGTIAEWSFVGESGSQAQTAASAMAAGVTAAPVTRSAGLVVSSGVGSINSSNWSLSATSDGTSYYTFAVTPPAGCVMDLTQLTVDTKASSTGPHSAGVGTSADAFAATTPVTASTSASVTNAALAVTDATGMIELRVFGWAATGSGGTLRIENTLTLTGRLR